MKIATASLLLGSETDPLLRERLSHALSDAGAAEVEHRWRMAGSQEIEVWTYRVGVHTLEVEAETYTGVSLRGPAALVEALAGRVRGEPDGGRHA